MHGCTNTPHNRLQTLHPQAFIFPNNRRLANSCFPTKQSFNPLCPFVQLPQNTFLLRPCPLALSRRYIGSSLVEACIAFGRRCRCSREGERTMGSECSASTTPFRDEHLTFRFSMLTGQACSMWFCAFPWTWLGLREPLDGESSRGAGPSYIVRYHALKRKLMSDIARKQKRKYS